MVHNDLKAEIESHESQFQLLPMRSDRAKFSTWSVPDEAAADDGAPVEQWIVATPAETHKTATWGQK